jgi:flavin-dependent dehydrogenase
MRDRFDQFLVTKALEDGAELLEGERVTGVEEKANGVQVELERGKRLGCQYLIGADGAESIIARSLSSQKPCTCFSQMPL